MFRKDFLEEVMFELALKDEQELAMATEGGGNGLCNKLGVRKHLASCSNRNPGMVRAL